jgi:hypothetical protein
MYSPEVLSQISIWRQKMLDKTMTEEEYIKAVEVMREGRKSALASATTAKKKATAAIPSADDILDGL